MALSCRCGAEPSVTNAAMAASAKVSATQSTLAESAGRPELAKPGVEHFHPRPMAGRRSAQLGHGVFAFNFACTSCSVPTVM
jgi:hypothetical protein